MKRDKGTGSVYQRSNGYWVAQYCGQYRYAKTKTEAKAKLRQMLKQADSLKPSKITVSTALNQYMDAVRRDLKPRTYTRYQGAITTHLLPAFGNQKLHKLTALEIEHLYSTMLGDGLSPSTVRVTHTVLGSAIRRAVRLNLMQTNVANDVQLPRLNTAEIEIFAPEEVEWILKAAANYRLNALYVLALSTGARQGELLGLQVQDFKPAVGTLAIRRTVYNGAVGSPKSKQGKRTIVLPKQARNALEEHITTNACKSWIFTTDKGHTLPSTHFLRGYWHPLLKKADIPYRTFHTCRHTVASTLLGQGLPIPAIARYLGHTPQTLLGTYAHCLPSQMELVASAMNHLLDLNHEV
jgi:integrase